MKNDRAFDDPSLETAEDVEIVLDMKPNMEYVFSTPDGFVCDLTLQALNNGLIFDAFKQGVLHSVLQVDLFQVKRCVQSRNIVHLEGDVNERICIIDFGVRDDIDAVCSLAIEHGAKAIIAKDVPRMHLSIPVFLVSISTMEKLTLHPDVQVNIQQKQQVSAKCESMSVIRNVTRSVRQGLDGSESFLPVDLVHTSVPLAAEVTSDCKKPLVCLL